MQVVMTMEEYEELTLKNKSVLNELQEKYENEMVTAQTHLMCTIKKLQAELKEKEVWGDGISLNLKLYELDWVLEWARIAKHNTNLTDAQYELLNRLHTLKNNIEY